MSIGIWLQETNRVRLTKTKGKFIHHMGYCELDERKTLEQKFQYDSSDENDDNDDVDKQNAKYLNTIILYPEEALFLLESVKLIFAD